MSEFIQAASQLLPVQESPWLQALQDSGRQQWLQQSMPNRKTENWKYTSLQSLSDGDYLRWPEVANNDGLEKYTVIPGLEAYRIVFVNGVYDAQLSSGIGLEGVTFCRFADANEQQQQLIQQYLGKAVPEKNHQFASLNASWLSDGVFICVDKGVQVDRPVQLVYLTTHQSKAFSVQQRCLVVVEESAKLDVIEHFVSTEEKQTSFTNGISEFVLEKNASMSHIRLHLEEEHALHIGGLHVCLNRDSRFNGFHLGVGGKLKRLDIVVNHQGQGSQCELNGIYLARNKQLIDYHTTIEHKEPHGRTRETFRGIISDQAKAVFNGRIHIHKNAQKVSAELNNKNLLTSHQAEVDTKPELEIYADDVECAHGATIAQLDDKSLYYMQARGIDRAKAEILLGFGFINELIVGLEDHNLQVFVRDKVLIMFSEQAIGDEAFYE